MVLDLDCMPDPAICAAYDILSLSVMGSGDASFDGVVNGPDKRLASARFEVDEVRGPIGGICADTGFPDLPVSLFQEETIYVKRVSDCS